jgi:fatty acid desaturase/nitrite reductase/ring-hydroxylating ferredoxin subunit
MERSKHVWRRSPACHNEHVAVLERPPAPRDYGLTGPNARRAIELGLADAQWYRPPIDPLRLQELTRRTNRRAARDVVLWLALLVAAGTVAWFSLGSWWAIPAFFVYGTLYGSSADSRWHECGHGTAFRSRWANDAVYYLASFMLLREPTLWRWSHVRHHSDTIIVGRDPEVVFTRPFTWRQLLPNLLNLVNGTKLLGRMARHATGNIDDEARDFIPDDELPKVAWEARAFLAVLGGVVVWSIATWSIVPLLFIGLPSFYGAWMLLFFAVTQHIGLREDVLDHRLNTRTVYMNPILRFLYLNMNYHLEHHLFPTVPYHALPALHREVAGHLPAPNTSVLDAYREIVDALRHQRHDPTWEIPGRVIPDGPAASAWVDPDTGHVADHGPAGICDLGPVDLLAPGQLTRLDVGSSTFVLCRPDDGYVLLDGMCTHAQTHLAGGLLIDGCIECPKHNGRFDLRTGEPVRRPVKVPLGTYPVHEEDGRLIADLSALAQTSTGLDSRTERQAASPTASGARPSAPDTGDVPPLRA